MVPLALLVLLQAEDAEALDALCELEGAPCSCEKGPARSSLRRFTASGAAREPVEITMAGDGR
jgi:hypothetical protein